VPFHELNGVLTFVVCALLSHSFSETNQKLRHEEALESDHAFLVCRADAVAVSRNGYRFD